MKLIPVKGCNGRWLAPCNPARVRELLRSGKAVRRSTLPLGDYLQLTLSTTKTAQPVRKEAA